MPAQKALGRPRIVALQSVVEALLYIANGVSVAFAAARFSPKEFVPMMIVQLVVSVAPARWGRRYAYHRLRLLTRKLTCAWQP